MTLTNTDRKITYTGNGSTTVWDYEFEIPESSHLIVKTYEIATGTETTISSSDYSVTGIGEEDGGTVTYPTSGSPLASTHRITIERLVPLTQQTDLANQGGWYPEVIEDRLDRTVMQVQQVDEEQGRSVKFNISSSAHASGAEIDDLVADKVLIVSSDASKIEMGPTADEISGAQASAAAAASSASDSAASAAASAVSETNSAASAAAAAASEAAAAASEAGAAAAAQTVVDEAINSVMEFNDYDYIAAGQITHIRGNAPGSQTASTVTSGLRAMFDAGFAFGFASNQIERIVVFRLRGIYRINDELFSETVAQYIWDQYAPANTRFIFDFRDAVFYLDGNASHKMTRTSGFWGEESITDDVPKVLFRWEQKTKRGYGPTIFGGTFKGERATTDPIVFKFRNVNKLYMEDTLIYDFCNTAIWIDDINNSKIKGVQVDDCGWQPTGSWNTGFIETGATFTTTAGSPSAGKTRVVASVASTFPSSAITNSQFFIEGAGTSDNVWGAEIDAYVNGTTIDLVGECPTNVSGKNGSFGVLKGSVTANSTALTLKYGVTTDLDGRFIMVYKGKSKLNTTQDLLVTRAVAHPGSGSVTLASQAGATVTDQPIIIAPTIFVGKSDDQHDGGVALSGHNNDVQFEGCRFEAVNSDIYNSAVTFVGQHILTCQFYGCKWHGTSPGIGNNFGSNFAAMVLDDCKHIPFDSCLVTWGMYHLDEGKIMVTGDRTFLQFNGCSLADDYSCDTEALFYIDPQNSGVDDCRIAWSGFFNTTDARTNLSGQALARYGTHGKADMLIAMGPVVRRGSVYYDKMPPFWMSKAVVASDAPVYELRDINSGKRFRLRASGGALIMDYDDNDDGVYDTEFYSFYSADPTSWTPALTFGGGSTGLTYASRSGEYVREGRFLWVRAQVTLSAKGSSTGTAALTIPGSFTPLYNEALQMNHATGFAATLNDIPVAFTITSGGGSFQFRMLGAAATGHTTLQNTHFTDTTSFEFTGRYLIV